jgi:excisionase family DNA binding protein
MITVPEAARRTGRNPETIRRWIREGRLRAQKVGTQHLIDEAELDDVTGTDVLPLPAWWPKSTPSGSRIPDSVAVIRRERAEH